MAKKTEAQITFRAVTSEFTSGIKDINSSLKTMQNQLKLNSAQLKGNGDSVELLQNRQQILQNELEASTQKVELTRQALQEAKNILGETSTEYKNLENALIRAQTQQQSIQNEINQTNNRLEELHNSANDARDGIEDLANEMQDTADESSRFGDVLAASLASDAITGVLDKITESLDAVKDSLVDFTMDSETGFNNLIAKTGASKGEFEELESIMNQIYADNFGEDMNDIADTMAIIIQQTGATGDELLKTSENALLLRDTFDFDVNESVRSANMLMQQFGLTSDEAFTLIAQGTQNGLDKNGDLLDTINEYSVHFKQAGYTADEMFNSLINGTKAGTFSVDKLGDAVKEFGIRMKDGSAEEALNSIGLKADDVVKRFAQGGNTASEAMGDVIEALYSIQDPLKQNEAGVALFGTTWEDLGADGINALMTIRGEVDSTADTLNQINEIKYDDLGSAIEGIKRGFLEDLKPALDLVLSGVEMVVTAFSNLPQGVQTTIAVIAFISITVLTLATAFGAVSACISAAIPVFTAIAGAIGAISAPVLIVIGVITGLIAIGVALYKNWDTVKANAVSIWNSITSTISNAVNKAKNVVNSGFKLINTYIVNPIKNAYNTVVSTFSNIYNTINTKINNAKDAVRSAIEKMKSFFNFKWSLPSIKLPHFSVSGSANPIDWLTQGVPKISVQWYAQGGIMDGATVFGMNGNSLMVGGESGREAILPLDGFYNYLDNKLDTIVASERIDYDRMTDSFISALKTMSITMSAKEVGRLTSKYTEEDINIRSKKAKRFGGDLDV